MRKTVLVSRRLITADVRVREALNDLRMRGYVVVHGDERDGEGSIDHLVSGPSGLFLVNSAGRRFSGEQLLETRRRAEELFRELRTWVTPVLCLPSGRGRDKPRRRERVWVVRRKRVVEWICGQRNPVLELERVSGLAERLALANCNGNGPRDAVVSTILLDRARAEWASEDDQLEPSYEGDPSI